MAHLIVGAMQAGQQRDRFRHERITLPNSCPFEIFISTQEVEIDDWSHFHQEDLLLTIERSAAQFESFSLPEDGEATEDTGRIRVSP